MKIDLTHGVTVFTNYEGGATITSDLHFLEMDEEDVAINKMIDAVEFLILAHVSAGVDISTKEYKQGVESALTKILSR